MTLVAYGDSWTYGSVADGWHDARQNGFDRELIYGSWVNQLRRWLQTLQMKTRVYNQGHGGWTSLQGAEAFEDMVSVLHPDLLLLNFGINDWKLPVPMDDYVQAMDSMIYKAKAMSCRIILWTSGPISAQSEEHYGWDHPIDDSHVLYRFSEMNSALREMALKHRVEFVDAERAILRRWEQDAEPVSWFYDAIHFTQPGHDFIFSAMKSNLSKYLTSK